MANGYYMVECGNGNELATGIQNFATANRVACNYIATHLHEVCVIYAVGGLCDDEWIVSLNSDGYGRPVTYVDEHGVKRVWDSVANHFTRCET